MNRKARTIGFLSVVGVILSQLGGAPTSIASPGPDGPGNGPLSSCWQPVRSRNYNLQNNALAAVDGLSQSDAWAVGSREEGLYDRTVGEHWNGTRWTLSLTADVGFNTALSDIAMIGSADVWAVGAYDTYTALAEHWDGTGWFVTSPVPIGVTSELDGVSGTSFSDVWAVGFYELDFSSPNLTLAYHWNGSAWTLVTTPNVGSSQNFLNDVDAISSDDVWAVGQYIGSDGMNRPLTEHWNGTGWTVVPSPDVAGARLEGVAALSSSDVWAVGDATPPGEAFAIHWDGSAWTQVPIPSVGVETYPQDVAGIASNDVWAVGYDTPNYEDWHTLILHWDGVRWRVYPHHIPYGPQQYFYGVAAIPGGEAWAVGSSLWSGPEVTYTQRFAAC